MNKFHQINQKWNWTEILQDGGTGQNGAGTTAKTKMAREKTKRAAAERAL